MRKIGACAVAILVSACPQMSRSASADQKTVAPFIDGMSITTSDSVATVEIRAQSLGPGLCAVEFRAGRDTVSMLAPPLKYTPWSVLASHFGSVSYTINDDVKCDTGIIAQVRYFAKSKTSPKRTR